MHQASILFTAAVMAMAGAWYVMQDMTRNDAPGPLRNSMRRWIRSANRWRNSRTADRQPLDGRQPSGRFSPKCA